MGSSKRGNRVATSIRSFPHPTQLAKNYIITSFPVLFHRQLTRHVPVSFRRTCELTQAPKKSYPQAPTSHHSTPTPPKPERFCVSRAGSGEGTEQLKDPDADRHRQIDTTCHRHSLTQTHKQLPGGVFICTFLPPPTYPPVSHPESRSVCVCRSLIV